MNNGKNPTIYDSSLAKIIKYLKSNSMLLNYQFRKITGFIVLQDS